MLLGRDQELALITEFVECAVTVGDALLLVGAPGVGKTALLRAAADHAVRAGATVLSTAGSEFGTAVTFAGLTQAIMPLLDQGDQQAGHRTALSVALGLADGPPPQQLMISQSVLALLRSAAAVDPVLVVVDDLQWMDPYSATVLRLVLPHLTGHRVGVLAASRPAAPSALGQSGMPQHHLGPLDPTASSALLRSRYPTLAPRVRQRLLDEAQGNPLALLELPPALTGPQRAALQHLPTVLPLSDRLRAVFASRVTQLPAPTRDLLLIAALDGTGDLRVLRAAVGAPILDNLAPAEREQLVAVDDDLHQLIFRHPLTRSAVVDLSTAAQRRHAHRALAGVLTDQPARLARHLAAVTDQPDEDVAATLESCAQQMVRRGDPTGAVTALTRAADLTPDADGRSRRLSAAAYIGGYMTLQLADLPKLLDQARQAHPDAVWTLHGVAAAAFAMLQHGDDLDAVHRTLTTAIEAHGGLYDVNTVGLLPALEMLQLVCSYARPALWQPFEAALARLSPAAPQSLRLLAATFADPARVSRAVLDELDTVIAVLAGEADQEDAGKICAAAVYVDRLSACHDTLRRAIRAENDGGAPVRGIVARLLLCTDAVETGRWDEVHQLASDGIAICDALGLIYAKNFQHCLAVLAAGRGDLETTDAITTDLVAWGMPRGAHLLQTLSWHVRCLAALGQGDFEEAFQNATAISPAGTFPPYEPTALRVCMDLVEAAVHTNRRGAAQAHVAAMYELDLPSISPRLALVTYASDAAATGDDERAFELFDRALAVHGADRWRFHHARVQLAYGERLNRARAGSAAQVQLQAAMTTFRSLQAHPWVTRTTRQLRVAGAPAAAKGTGAAAGLTVQELGIARLAAAGLTNKQIGEQLHLSHRTVSTHLYRAFPKLGIATRAALRDALADPAPPIGEDR